MAGARGILATQPKRVNHTPSGGGVALAARAAGPGFPQPDSGATRAAWGHVLAAHSPWLDPSPRVDRRDRLDLHQHPRIGQLVDGHVAQGWTRQRETAASHSGASLQVRGVDTVTEPGSPTHQPWHNAILGRGSASTHETVTRPSNETRLQALIGAAKSNVLVAALAITAKASSLRAFGSASPTRPSPLRMKGITGLDTASACVS